MFGRGTWRAVFAGAFFVYFLTSGDSADVARARDRQHAGSRRGRGARRARRRRCGRVPQRAQRVPIRGGSDGQHEYHRHARRAHDSFRDARLERFRLQLADVVARQSDGHARDRAVHDALGDDPDPVAEITRPVRDFRSARALHPTRGRGARRLCRPVSVGHPELSARVPLCAVLLVGGVPTSAAAWSRRRRPVRGLAVWGTVRRLRPVLRESQNEALVLLHAYTSVMSVMAMVLAVVVAEHKHAEAQLRELAITIRSRASRTIGASSR